MKDILGKYCTRMSVTKLAYLLSFALLVEVALGAAPIYHYCLGPFFSVDDSYESYLNQLLVNLRSWALNHEGYGADREGPNDQVYGVALCRGDVKTADCQTCLTDASSEIRRRCPTDKAAIIWYDNCMLKYSNENFFNLADYQHNFYICNLQGVADPGLFNQKKAELLQKVTAGAYSTTRRYATREIEVGGSLNQKIYGLAQCTRDLYLRNCRKCLHRIMGMLINNCDGKLGGQIASASCSIRYEVHPFVNV